MQTYSHCDNGASVKFIQGFKQRILGPGIVDVNRTTVLISAEGN